MFVGISYDADIKKAKAVLQELFLQEPARVATEEVNVFVEALEDSSVKIGCRVWVKSEEYWPARWRLIESMKEKLEEAGIEIPFNQLNVSVTKMQ